MLSLRRMRSAPALWILLASMASAAGAPPLVIDSNGKPLDPFASAAKARVFLFVRTDCPLTNRYAPELRRIASDFASRGVEFWLVYPDRAETASGIEGHIAEY